MYEKDGRRFYVVDGHIHLWDGSPANQRNKYGAGWIQCFYDYHKGLSPEEWLWSKDKFERYEVDDLLRDVFEEGHVDVGIFLPTILSEFFVNGFHRHEEAIALRDAYPDKIILNGAWDPRDGEAGLERFEEEARRLGYRGVKLYTAEWRDGSKGYSLTDPMSYRYLEKCQELGVTNIHVHKGPTVWPLNRDAFDVHDIDDVATAFPDLNFIVEHIGLPRLEDFCWIATQESNVYAGMAVAMPFIHGRPRYFAQIMGELIYWLGEDKILFASDYAIWHPKWLVEKFVDFQIPADMQSEYGTISDEAKAKILGLNAARLYDLPVPDGVAGAPRHLAEV
ncbi:Amidohydrolase 2 [Carbonactinospora thermoautotrophica]|uniref:Amidohydrolase 2 n=1 Tax=Carbonactinospora thermoautotrophica TaxID=1469144 RepID=A0A132MSW2_9ACTN|nr:amidohydrolase family protein [Carbonactinospora thermoautotrophica]KWX00975.1 Amidohydrolase 2 [Carbonactinospora thermoautotrophica]